MSISNHRAVKKLFIVMMLSLLSACSSRVERVEQEEAATFYVDAIEGSSEVSKVDALFSLPKERLYSFKACLKDIVQNKAVLGLKFKIKGGQEEKIVRTDEQGCLNWSEFVSYHFVSPSQYIQSQRRLEALELHKGVAAVDLAINPWSHGEDTSSVIDTEKKAVFGLKVGAEGKSALSAMTSRSPLWAIFPRVSIAETEFSGDGANMSLKFQTKLALLLKNTKNQSVQHPLSSGVFDIEMILFSSYQEGDKKVLTKIASGKKSQVSFIQDQLVSEFTFNVTALPNKGQIFMALKIVPQNNEVGIDNFESVYMISNSSNIKVDASPVVVAGMSFDDVNSKLLPETQMTSGAISPGLEVERLDIRFFKIGAETTTDRQVFFNVKACIKSNLDSRVIRNEEFLVTTASSKTAIAMKSNNEGCISWDDFVWHKFFAKEGFVAKTITIKNTSLNLNKQIEILVNPWDNGANFGRDKRFVQELGSLASNPSSSNAQILIDNYQFSVLNYKYEINKNLDLSVIKNGVFSLSAKIVNHSSFSHGRMGSESLRDGHYLLKWAVVLVDKNETAQQVLDRGARAVRAFGGDIKTDLALKISTFEKLNTRARLILALYPVKEAKSQGAGVVVDRNSSLAATPHIGTIILNNDQESQRVQRLDHNLGLGSGDIFDRLDALITKLATSENALEKGLIAANLKKINLSSEKDSQALRDGLANPHKYYTQKYNSAYYHEANQKPLIPAAQLIAAVKNGKLSPELSRQFCQYWFNDFLKRAKPNSRGGVLNVNATSSLVNSCLFSANRESASFFKVEKKTLVHKVGGIKYLGGTATNLNVGTSFNVSQAESVSTSHTWAWNTSVGLSLSFFDIVKAGTSGSYNLSRSYSKSENTTNSSQVSASSNLSLQANSFNIELASYEECLAIRLNPELLMGERNRFSRVWAEGLNPSEIAKAATAGFFLCTGQKNEAPKTITESYYLVAKDLSSNAGIQDAHAEENQPLLMHFRGKNDLARFVSMINGEIKKQSSAGFEQNIATQNISLSNLTLLPTWPGILSQNP